ncbi:hypothetical protein BS78_05G167300 [Paspalum vaginatum]|nr:hypothetical protein BS78_05G167300 [Paspalum vaginatum]KAJ1275844.1 hypothetical protein BS78_05G167300 [Paspalum vaginatum]KAJ1275845.1 hypothetical protein BS78_05G167300 [Paspalum vaginatum]KAJ1275846.1 hypothetical protein BS78_05G167300 [Paspalum vaginatum]KAJ1275847.1 hypothetical protein BS78_05G167300 [Paspalum vaginatum]
MDAGLLSAVMNNIVGRLFTLAEQKYKLYKNFNYDVDYMKKELEFLTCAIDMQLSGHIEIDAQPQLRLPVDRLRQVAHEMEDCLDRIMYRQTRKEQHESDKTGNTGKSVLIKEMQRLKKVIEDAVDCNNRYFVPHPITPQQQKYSSDRLVPPEDRMGINGPLKELQKQLEEENPKQLKVISIVGSCGSGKTVLAQELYDREKAARNFELIAWVGAADMTPIELITDILRQVPLESPPVVNPKTIREHTILLRNRLAKKRYFIVIDHLQSTIEWKDIKYAFPSRDSSSRIVVTTKIQTVADSFSCPNGYVHKMRSLDRKHSRQLLLKEASMEGYLTSPPSDSKAILDICDGQPLALSTVGQFMGKRSRATGPYLEGLCDQLRGQLKEDMSLDKMHQALIHDYSSLPCPALRACLLYFAMFPIDHRVRTKRLMRRWLAEGFVKRPSSRCDPAAQKFQELLDRNIIKPIDISNNMMVKTCKTYAMMHLFITLKSRSEYFIASFDDVNLELNNVRRLSIHDNNIADDSSLKIDLSLVRSLIVFRKAGKAILDFGKYQLLKVLDLEECSDLQNEHLDEVCNLLLLKYLSLGNNVTTVPKNIKKLKLLETLDLRRTAIETLAIEVLLLPKLLHLFGMFKLPDVDVKNSKFLSSAKSELQTLAGFIFHGSKGFVELMRYLKKLQKVELWCESSASGISLTNLQEAIQEFICEETDARKKDPRSLSVHFNGCSEELLKCLEGDCHLSSLKLHGKLQELPGFVTALPELRELCLESKKLTAALLTALFTLKKVQYLKLIADELDESVLKADTLPNLLRLCFVLKKPTFPTIEDGALPKLESLQLLCDGLNGLSGIQINHFIQLREVIIDIGVRVNRCTKQIWLDAADNHPNRPNVILLNAPREDCAVSGVTEYGAETQMRPNRSNSTLTGSSIASSSVTVPS